MQHKVIATDLAKNSDESLKKTVPDTFFYWAQLARIPNTLTAVADILAGCAMATGAWQPGWRLIALCLASVAFYWAGMILNDVFDLDQDRAHNRKRPLVEGKVSVGAARLVGWILLGVGLFGCFVQTPWNDLNVSRWTSLGVGILLTVTILAYDSSFKATMIGPVLMGACRGLNMLLGATIASSMVDSTLVISDGVISEGLTMPHIWWAVVGHTIYVTGFTIAARREAIDSQRRGLILGWSLSMIGLIVLATVPWIASGRMNLNLAPETMYPILIGLLSYPLVKRAYQSIRSPSPQAVQRSIKQAIMTIIALDAALVAEFVDSTSGIITILLIVPSLLMGMRFKST